MDEFIAKHQGQIAGVLSRFDRLVFRGTLRRIAYPFGLEGFLWANQVPLKEFGGFAQRLSETVKAGAVEVMQTADRPVKYLYSSRTDKEQEARDIAAADRIEEGPVCALTCVEPCYSYDIHRNSQTRKLDLVQRSRKCLFVYQYWLDPAFGWMNARIQTWLPFSIQICLNGREWLARQMTQAGIGYEKRDNCFVWVEDWLRAQQLFDEQLRAAWPQLLDRIASRLSPHHDELFAKLPVDYYWSACQTEWATDVTVQRQEDLRRLFPLWLRHAILTFQSPDVLRFFGKRLTNAGEVPATVEAEVTTSLKRRQPGTRVKHWYGSNSLKIYDKAYAEAGSTFRTEVTMQNPEPFKVYRRPEGEPAKPQRWYRLRQGVADLHGRAEICQKINERYLNALAVVDTDTSLEELLAAIQRPVVRHQKRHRALQPFAEPDVILLQTNSRGEFLVQGLRNRDLQQALYPGSGASPQQRRKRSAAISRKLRLLRAHGLIRKVPSTHRYLVTEHGREILAAIMAARKTTLKHLNTKAA
jgi:DNA-binding HxlR family transcriptional regulator